MLLGKWTPSNDSKQGSTHHCGSMSPSNHQLKRCPPSYVGICRRGDNPLSLSRKNKWAKYDNVLIGRVYRIPVYQMSIPSSVHTHLCPPLVDTTDGRRRRFNEHFTSDRPPPLLGISANCPLFHKCEDTGGVWSARDTLI